MVEKLKGWVSGFFKYLPLLRELVIRDIKVRYRHSVLGLLWTVLNPLLMMAVMTIIFSTLFRNSIENFSLYYLSGYILFTFFNESTTQALFSVVNNSTLTKKVYIPKYLFPLSKVVSALINLGFSFCALLIVMLLTGAPFYWTIVLSVVPALYMAVFCCGFGMILSTLFVFFRDIGHLYGVITLIWMYLTPLFYPEELLIDNGLEILLRLNPVYQNVSYFRMLIMEGTVPGLAQNLACIIPAVFFLVFGVYIFWKRQDEFILYV